MDSMQVKGVGSIRARERGEQEKGGKGRKEGNQSAFFFFYFSAKLLEKINHEEAERKIDDGKLESRNGESK